MLYAYSWTSFCSQTYTIQFSGGSYPSRKAGPPGSIRSFGAVAVTFLVLENEQPDPRALTARRTPRPCLGKAFLEHHHLPPPTTTRAPRNRASLFANDALFAQQWPLPPTATVPFAVSFSGRHRSPSTFDAAATERASPSMPVASLSLARRLQATLPRRRRLLLQCCSTRPKP